MQSFLGSLNYYSRFIEDFAIYASVLYELREADFHEIRRFHKGIDCAASKDHACDTQVKADKGRSPTADSDRQLVTTKGHDHLLTEESNSDYTGGHRWEKAMIAFTMLKAKVAQTPVSRHFDPDRRPVIVVYASKWAVSAALLQEHDGVNWPVMFTSRTLKSTEISNGAVEKEVLALLRILDICYTLLVSRDIKVLTRYSTLAWLVQSSGLNGRLGRWAALLSTWTF